MLVAPANRRATPHYWGGQTRGFAPVAVSDTLWLVTRSQFCRVADPHNPPDRFAISQGGPSARVGGNTSAIAYHVTLRIALCVKAANSWLRNTIIEGSKKCKNLLFFWLRSQLLALLAVSTMTQNAALWAQAQVLSPLKFLAQTLLAPQRLAQPQACSVMTQAYAGKINSRAIPARLNLMNRRWGQTLAAIFCLGDGK